MIGDVSIVAGGSLGVNQKGYMKFGPISMHTPEKTENGIPDQSNQSQDTDVLRLESCPIGYFNGKWISVTSSFSAVSAGSEIYTSKGCCFLLLLKALFCCIFIPVLHALPKCL